MRFLMISFQISPLGPVPAQPLLGPPSSALLLSPVVISLICSSLHFPCTVPSESAHCVSPVPVSPICSLSHYFSQSVWLLEITFSKVPIYVFILSFLYLFIFPLCFTPFCTFWIIPLCFPDFPLSCVGHSSIISPRNCTLQNWHNFLELSIVWKSLFLHYTHSYGRSPIAIPTLVAEPNFYYFLWYFPLQFQTGKFFGHPWKHIS
jgi:hypothetical protein